MEMKNLSGKEHFNLHCNAIAMFMKTEGKHRFNDIFIVVVYYYLEIIEQGNPLYGFFLVERSKKKIGVRTGNTRHT